MEEEGNSCPACTQFNYCFWAKILVAIPAIPIAVFLAAAQFTSEWAQVMAGGLTGFALIYLAIWIDHIPFLRRKVRKHKS